VEFKPGTEDGILPLPVAAELLSTPRHSGRLDPHYVSKAPDTTAAFLAHLAKVTDNSPYWDPKQG
jgi:hypothetical protein